MNYKTLNWARRIISYPFRLATLVAFFPIVLLDTNWEDDWDRKYAHKFLKELWKL